MHEASYLVFARCKHAKVMDKVQNEFACMSFPLLNTCWWVPLMCHEAEFEHLNKSNMNNLLFSIYVGIKTMK